MTRDGEIDAIRDTNVGNDKVQAPYTFIPINKTVLTVDEPSHARPRADGVSGRIKIRITNETPLLVGGSDNNAPFRTPDGRYAIPGASLRGMIRAVVETIAFGRVNFTDDHPAAIRDFMAWRWNRRSAGLQNERRSAGWLFEVTSRRDGRKHITYHLLKAEKTEKVPLQQIAGSLANCSVTEWHDASLHTRLTLLGPLTGLNPAADYRLPGHGEGRAQLVMSGDTSRSGQSGAKAKRSEYLAFLPESVQPEDLETIPGAIGGNFVNSLNRDANGEKGAPKANFDALRRTGPMTRFGKGTLAEQLEQPDVHGLPVFWHEAPGEEIMLSMTALFRIAYKNNMRDVLGRTQPDPAPDRLDLAEALFGWAPPDVAVANANLRGAREKSWRGRVRFSIATGPETDKDKISKKSLPGIAPRPSFHPFYLRPGDDGAQHPVDLDNPKAIVSGRKRYPARQGITEPPRIEGDRQNPTVDFLHEGQEFTAEIRLHNAAPEEAGALIWALVLGQTAEDRGLRHMLGRGRNWGHGQVRIEITEAALTKVISGDDVSQGDAIAAFKAWVAQGLGAAGEEITEFDAREEIQRLLGSCHAPTGAALLDDLYYVGERKGHHVSDDILQAHVRIRKASTNHKEKNRPSAPRDPGSAGFIGLPPWPRFDWREKDPEGEE